MFPEDGEVALKTAQETSRVLTTKSVSPTALPDMKGQVRKSCLKATAASRHGEVCHLHRRRVDRRPPPRDTSHRRCPAVDRANRPHHLYASRITRAFVRVHQGAVVATDAMLR
jgi:hypothetical protein